MLTFVLRRTLATFLVLLAASFVVYLLTAYSGNPLADLIGSRDPNREELIAERIRELNLETPVPLRYFSWLAGVGGCFVGQCDLGQSYVTNQEVTAALAAAVPATLSLVTAATVIAIILGIAVGMVSALRQYSGFDYTITFITFVLYSLPVFWVAVLLKEWGAIRVNQFMADPAVPILGVIAFGAVGGLIWQAIIGGAVKRRAMTFAVSGLVTGGILGILLVTGWFSQPSIGILGIIILSIGTAAVVLLAAGGFRQRPYLIAVLGTVVVLVALWYPLQFLFFGLREVIWVIPLTLLGSIAIGVVLGIIFGGENKPTLARWAGITGGVVGLVILLDRVLLVFDEYSNKIPLSSGVIPTIGATTPNLSGDVWIETLDLIAHLILPTLALTLISFAGYTRYARASLLEVMNQDYVRTARAKGLSERVVVLRHAFRNALIPITTIVVLDFGALIGGAVITERIFGWQAMGTLFINGLTRTDVNLVMGFFLITGVLVVIANILADLVYSALDPRIRVS